MAKTKHKKKTRSPSAGNVNTPPLPGTLPIQTFAQKVFKQRAIQFQKQGSEVDAIYEGLDFDPIRMKRRISSVLSVVDEVVSRYSDICPDVPAIFSLAEDWVTMNSYPVSAYDHVEKHIFSALGAAIWILDNIRDQGKTEKLTKILCGTPYADEILMPDVWDPCHSQQMLRQMLWVIHNRNADCHVTEKAIRKNRASLERIYMDRATAENKIDHNVPSRSLFDQILALIDPDALSAIEHTYKEKHWDWLSRYFRCRAIFIREECSIRDEIMEFQDQIQRTKAQMPILSQNPEFVSVLSNATNAGTFSCLSLEPSSEQILQAKTMEYQNKSLFEKQERFHARFNSFIREVGEFALLPSDEISNRFGDEIAHIWEGFEIEDPYSMCMAFLSLLDQNSDLPWCYFPSVILQSAYIGMLPWTRTRFISSCDDIWEHYDADLDSIVPGPTDQPLSKKIKIPDLVNWYRLQYQDAAKSRINDNSLYSLSHIIYETTGCLMPRTPRRYLAALSTLNRYGINTKKENQNLLYCMSLLGEAKNQSLAVQASSPSQMRSGPVADSVEELQAQVIALQEELNQCKLTLQNTVQKNGRQTSVIAQMQKDLAHRDILLHDLSSIVFDCKIPTVSHTPDIPCHISSNYIVFSMDQEWRLQMQDKLPDIHFFSEATRENAVLFRGSEIIWIHKKMTFEGSRRIIMEARKCNVPVRILPFADVPSCTTLLIQADLSR